MSVLYVSKVLSVNGRDGYAANSNGNLNLSMCKPKGLSGVDAKPGTTNPEELFALAYATCFGDSIKEVARRQNRIIPDPQVTAQVGLNHSEIDDFYLTIKLNVKIGDLSKAEKNELIQAAQQICPYSKAVSNNVQINLS